MDGAPFPLRASSTRISFIFFSSKHNKMKMQRSLNFRILDLMKRKNKNVQHDSILEKNHLNLNDERQKKSKKKSKSKK